MMQTTRTLTEDSIYTPIVLRIVGDLGVLSKDDLSSCSDHTQLGDVDLNDGTLGEDTKLSVHGGLGVLLDAEDL